MGVMLLGFCLASSAFGVCFLFQAGMFLLRITIIMIEEVRIDVQSKSPSQPGSSHEKRCDGIDEPAIFIP
ncbi:hypothetical protein VTJ04DRAFT_3173 [Mycothermus thermophilus]|uniref:uncharacterized protein n=1 Tax=Humicola insolens TaxID=85995 RepID=UPI003743FDC4